MTFRLFILLFLVIFSKSTLARQKKDFDWSIHYLPEHNTSLSWKEVLNTPNSHYLKDTHYAISLGYSAKACWIKVVIVNKSNSIQDLILEQENIHVDTANLYQISHNKLLKINHRASMYFSKEGPGAFPSTLIHRVKLVPHDSATVLLRMRALSSLKSRVNLSPYTQHLKVQQQKNMLYSLFTGVMAFVLTFSLFLYFTIKDRIYLYYSGYVLFFWLSLVCMNGFSFYLFPFGMTDLRQVLSFLVSIFALQFTGLFLSIKEYRPKLAKWINYLVIYILFCLAIYLSFLAGHIDLYHNRPALVVVAILYNIMLIATSITLLSCIYVAIKQKNLTGWFYLIGLSPILIITLMVVLSNFSLIPFYRSIDAYFVFASSFEVTVLCLGLAYRFKNYKDTQEKLLIDYNATQKELVTSLVTGQELERKRLSEELHDSLGQWLALTKFEIENLSLKQHNQEGLNVIRDYVDHSIKELRHISYAMMPVALIHSGLGLAVQEIVSKIQQSGKLKMFLYCDTELETIENKQLETALFRIIQESITNIVKHSKASEASIQLTLENDRIKLMIEDNGEGFDTQTRSKGNGLKNILSRIQLINGTIEISSNEKGTLLFIDVPFI